MRDEGLPNQGRWLSATLSPGRIVELPGITDPGGNLTFIESTQHVPFAVKGACSVNDVPNGEANSSHAQYRLQHLILAASGSFDVVVDDGIDRQNFLLDRSYSRSHNLCMIWREVQNSSSRCVRLMFASQRYKAVDYIRDHAKLLNGLRRTS